MKFFYLIIFSFFFIVGAALGSQHLNVSETKFLDTKEKAVILEKIPPIPVLRSDTVVPTFTAQSVVVKDETSGMVLFQKNPDLTLPPASTTKIISALTALDYYRDGTVLTVDGVKTVGQKMGLVEGEKMETKDLLQGLLVYSANDAAEVLAQNYCSTTSVEGKVNCGTLAFVDAMNEKAKSIGLKNTHFTNPAGLDDLEHYSSANDLVKATEYAMKNDFFRQTVGTKDIVVTSTDGYIIHELSNINELLWDVPGVLGVKTGWTENAHENLVTYIERDGRKIMMAVLGSEDRFGESENLINWVFDNYTWVSSD